MKDKKMDFVINEGDGAFYGPKIDFHLTDAIGRTWQCGTIQVDFSMPEKFGLTYEGSDGKAHTPVMVHRAIYGSVERFLGILIEHYAGKFPLWINPSQVKILTVADTFNEYAEGVYKQLKDLGYRVELDDRNESLGKKVREAKKAKVPYYIVIGDKDMEAGMITVENRDTESSEQMSTEDFIKLLK